MELERARAVHALGAPCPAVFEQDRARGPAGHRVRTHRRAAAAGVAAPRTRRDRAAWPSARPRFTARCTRCACRPTRPLPRLHDWIGRYLARLPEGPRERAQAELARLPDDTGLCHIDLHPGNVIVRGEALVVVDWPNAELGPARARRGALVRAARLEGATQTRRPRPGDPARAGPGATGRPCARIPASRPASFERALALRRARAAARTAREPVRERASSRDPVAVDCRRR